VIFVSAPLEILLVILAEVVTEVVLGVEGCGMPGALLVVAVVL
jgi:hypothetical protein